MIGDHVPLPELALGGATAVEIILGVPLLLGFHARWIGLILAAYILICDLALHPFWSATGVQQADQMTHFFEGIGITGGLLMVAAFGPGAISMDAKKQT